MLNDERIEKIYKKKEKTEGQINEEERRKRQDAERRRKEERQKREEAQRKALKQRLKQIGKSLKRVLTSSLV